MRHTVPCTRNSKPTGREQHHRLPRQKELGNRKNTKFIPFRQYVVSAPVPGGKPPREARGVFPTSAGGDTQATDSSAHLGGIAEGLDVVEADAVHTIRQPGNLRVEEDAACIDSDLRHIGGERLAGVTLDPHVEKDLGAVPVAVSEIDCAATKRLQHTLLLSLIDFGYIARVWSALA